MSHTYPHGNTIKVWRPRRCQRPMFACLCAAPLRAFHLRRRRAELRSGQRRCGQVEPPHAPLCEVGFGIERTRSDLLRSGQWIKSAWWPIRGCARHCDSREFQVTTRTYRDLHLCVDDPVKILLAFVGATRASLNPTEEFRMPFHSVIGPLGCFFSLAIFDLRLFICGHLVVSL